MNLKHRWIVVTAMVAATGFGDGVAYACDERSLIYQRQAPIVEMVDSQPYPSADGQAGG